MCKAKANLVNPILAYMQIATVADWYSKGRVVVETGDRAF